MVVTIWLISPIVLPIESIALTASWVADCTPEIWARMSSVALEVWVARFFTSDATTAKPLPASPARAASMVALSARRLVWSAMSLISATISPIFCDAPARPLTMALAVPASVTAFCAMRLEWPTWRAISAIDDDSSSAAAATV